jgi:gliding motility-associated-like protein
MAIGYVPLSTENPFFALNPLCLKKAVILYLALACLYYANPATAQQVLRGQIIQGQGGISPLDPNGDGFISKFSTGFSPNTNYWVPEFETRMFGIPKLTGDVTGDNIGKSCGITDLTPDINGYSVYGVRDASNNLVFRFRVGANNPSVEAWTILLDTDGLFGANDPNATNDNPGFEIDISLIKNQNFGVIVYNIDGASGCGNKLITYPLNTHFQISLADEVSCADPDYFYDIYVPFADLVTYFGISLNTGIRIAAVSNTSATCALSGKIADISGVNYDDYRNNVNAAFNALVSNQCPTSINNLCSTCTGFTNQAVNKPGINTPVRAGQSVLTGTADNNIYITAQIFSRTGGTDQSPIWASTPREQRSVYANGTNWSVSLSSPLLAYDKIVAIAQKDEFSLPCGLNGGTQTSTSVTVVQPNTPPSAQNQNVSVNEDVAKGIILVGTDPENDVLSYAILSNPVHGTLSGTAPNLTYTPAANYNGTDAFTFRVSDGIYNSTTGTISITVAPINDTPVANGKNVTTNEDTSLPITLTGSDIEGSALTYSIVTAPQHGTLTGSAPNVTYIPTANYNGSDFFTFKVNDGTIDSAPANVSITITAVPDAPVTNDQNVTVIEDTPKTITLMGTDVDGDALTYSIIANPTHGTLSGTIPNLTYTPALNYNGVDEFKFRVNDGTTNSNTATVSITVDPINDAPVANDQSVTVTEDVAKAITLTGSDIDGNPLTYELVSPSPAHGVLTGTAPNLLYTPAANFNGSDEFFFRVKDGILYSGTAKVSITVTAINDAPVANSQTITLAEDTPTSVILIGSDVDGNAISYSIVTSPGHGTLTLNGTSPNITYTPALNYNGPDNFTFRVNDGAVNSNTATVTITVSPVNDAPVANGQSVTVTEDIAKAVTLTGSDIDGNTITYSVVVGPSHGVLSGSAPNLTYTPTLNYNGPDEFTFKVNDLSVDSNIATVSITITAVNDQPVANNQSLTISEDVTTPIILTGNDPEGSTLTYSIIGSPTHGTITGSGASISYVPNLNYNGTDNFTFKVNDGIFDSNPGTISITINAVNDAPIANNLTVAYDLNTPAAVTLTGVDADLNALTYIVLTSPAGGVLSGTAPALTYSPNPGFNGTTTFTFKVNDGTTDSNVATVTLNLRPLTNQAPIASSKTVNVTEDVAKAITLDASDADGNPLTYTITSIPTNGTLTGAGANRTYTPNSNYVGGDVIKFEVSDGPVISNTGTITIIVDPVNDAPIANTQSVSLNEDDTLPIVLSGTDVEGSSLTYSIVSAPTHGGLSGTVPNVVYTPASDYFGSDSFSFKVNDGSLDSSPATITIGVTAVNDIPVADSQNLSTNENTQLSVTLAATDLDGNALTYSIVSSPSNGALSGTAPNLTYTPALNFNGTETFTFKAFDGTSDSNIATIFIDVIAVNDAPIANSQSFVINEDTPQNITLTGNDVDGDALGFVIQALPDHGTLNGTAPNIVYTPSANYNGPDFFTFYVNDGTVNSTISTIFITVTSVDDPPMATDQNVTAVEDTQTTITLVGTDPDGNTLSYTVLTPPSHGIINGTGPNQTYTPDANYHGADSFTFKVNDGVSDSNTGTVSVGISTTNDAPVAGNQSVATAEDIATSITLIGSDVDGDALTFSIVSQPANGILTGTGTNLTYTPALNFFGSDSFTFKNNDGTTNSNTATVSITVTPLNDAPVADNKTVTAIEDSSSNSITLTGSDVDGNTITFTLLSQPQHGTLTGTAPNLSYTPQADFSRVDIFTFKVNDGFLDSGVGTITINVTPQNDAPIANNQNVNVVEDISTAITLIGTDPDGSPLTYTIITAPLHGSLTGTGSTVSYTSQLNYSGTDSFSFKVNDGTSDSNTATVSIIVMPVNDPPTIATVPLIYILEDASRLVCLSAIDVDGDNIIYNQPSNNLGGGKMTKSSTFDFCYVFEPAANYNGRSIWKLGACDNENPSLCSQVDAEIIITPVNDAPDAINDFLVVQSRTEVSINALENDLPILAPFKEFYDIYEKDSVDRLTLDSVKGFHGSAVLDASNNRIRYLPDYTYEGVDSIRYWMHDYKGLKDSAIVVLEVGPPPFRIYEGVSPNGDGLNEYWRIDGIEEFPGNRIQIFDRFNNLVYETRAYSNESNNWKGTSNHGLVKETLPEGTYYYSINLGDGSKLLSGFVVLKRN